jgi:SNF2 family DNA or RNA helicase
MSKVASDTNLVSSQGSKQLSNADKLAFNKALRDAKAKEQEGSFAEALKLYQQADAIYSAHDKLKKKINHLLQKILTEREENKENARVNQTTSTIKTPAKVKEEIKKVSKHVIEESDEEEGDESEEDSQSADPAKDSYEKLDEDYFINTRTRECVIDYQQAKRFVLPEKVYKELLPHQKEGIAWLWKLFKNRKGGILGDDMGLGKSVQISSFLGALFRQKQIERCLIIAPTSLIEEPWEKELNKWASGVNIKKFHGTSVVQREKALTSVINRGGVALTTYGMVRENVDKVNQTTWDLIVLDEAHVIKKHTNKIYQIMLQVKATRRMLLTATPIMNNLTELWALINFISDGQLLGHITTFHTEFERPILAGNSRNANATQKHLSSALTQKLRKIIHPYFLRREKKDVFKTSDDPVPAPIAAPVADETNQLAQSSESVEALVDPLEKLTIKVKKNDYVVWIKLKPVQIKLYADFLAVPEIQEILNKTRSPLAALSVLRKICDHPQLLSTMVEYSNVFNLKDTLQKTTVVQQSAKLQFVVSLMQDLRKNNHRVLIFSQSTKMLDIIQLVFKEEGHKVIRIDGEIPLKERQQRINTFNTDRSYFCFLLSTKVGGFGLNLTSADRVIIFDPSWNTTDNQAVDRAYRIGQQKNVVVYRLITCSTIEEKIYRKQIFKDDLMRMMTQKTQAQPRRLFSDEELKIELKQMFQFENPDASLTQQILEEYLNKFKRQNENRRQSLETHVAYLRSNSLVFGLSPHDLVLDGDKLRNIWARRASQFGTRSPSNTNVNAQNMLANRSRSNAPHSPADPDFAHSDLINEVADKSLQKLQKTILPLHVVEHQRQVDHEEMSAQKSEVKRKRLQKMEEDEDVMQRSPTRVQQPVPAVVINRKRIIADDSDDEGNYSRNPYIADEASEAEEVPDHECERSFEQYLSEGEAEQERTAVDLHSEEGSQDEGLNQYEKDSFVASEDEDEDDDEEDDGYATAHDEEDDYNDEEEDDEINRQIRNSVLPRMNAHHDVEEEEVVDLTGPIDVNDVAQALRTMRIREESDNEAGDEFNSEDEENYEEYDRQYSEEEYEPEDDVIVDVDSPTLPSRSMARVEDQLQQADQSASRDNHRGVDEEYDGHNEQTDADVDVNTEDVKDEAVDMNEAFMESDHEGQGDVAAEMQEGVDDEPCEEDSESKSADEDIVPVEAHIVEEKPLPVKVEEETVEDDFGIDDFSLVNDLHLTETARKSLPRPVESVSDVVDSAQVEEHSASEFDLPFEDTAAAAREDAEVTETHAEEQATEEVAKEAQACEEEDSGEDSENSPERTFAPRKSVFGDADLGNFLLSQLNSAPRDVSEEDSESEDEASIDETFEDVPVYDYHRSALSGEEEVDEENEVEDEADLEDDSQSVDDDEIKRQEEIKALLDRIDINTAAVKPAEEEKFEEEDQIHEEGRIGEEEHSEHEELAEEEQAESNADLDNTIHDEHHSDECDDECDEHDETTHDIQASESEEEVVPQKKASNKRRVIDDSESDTGNLSFEGYITGEEEDPEPEEESPVKPVVKKNKVKTHKKENKVQKAATIEISDDEEEPIWDHTPKIKKLARKNSAEDFKEPKSAQKTISKSLPKSWEISRREFLLNKESIAKQLFDEFNTRIFGGKMDKLDLVWSKALTNCAGKYCVTIENKQKYCCIKLSGKFLTTADRLKSTLIHEMCHAATHLIDDEIDEAHGPVWFKWTKIAEATYPGIKITRCHSYDIEPEFQQKNQYACTNSSCDSVTGSMYKLRKAEKVCAKCRRGSLELLP